MSCHGFLSVTTPTVIITCLSDPASYYLAKRIECCLKSRRSVCKYNRTIFQENQCFSVTQIIHFLACKAVIPSICWNIKWNCNYKIFIQQISVCLVWWKTCWTHYQKVSTIFSNNVLTNLSINTSSVNGFTIWTQMIIWNDHKNEKYIKRRKNVSHI